MTTLQQVIVMAFGALVAIGGFVFWFLRKESGENEIVIFGQKAKVSAPALVVVLVGCAIFVLPVVLPFIMDRPLQTDATRQDTPTKPSREAAAPDAKARPGPQASTVDGQESEPNSRITQANLIQLGSTTVGKMKNERDQDFYQVRTGPNTDRVRIILRKDLSRTFHAGVYVFDMNERIVKDFTAGDHVNLSFAFNAESNTDYIIRVTCRVICPANAPYELVVREEKT